MSPAPAIRNWLSGTDRVRVGYYAVVTLYVCSWLVVVRGNRPDARLLPVIVAGALLAGICLRAASARFAGGDRPASGIGPDEEAETPVDARRAAAAFGWLAVLVTSVAALGLLPGVGLVVTAAVGRYEGYRRGLLVGVGTAVFVAVLFVWLLDLPTLEPYVLRFLERGGG